MKNTAQKPAKPEAVKIPKHYTSWENTLSEKHQKANEFIRRVKLKFE